MHGYLARATGEIEVGLDHNKVTANPKEILAFRNNAVGGDLLPPQEFEDLFVLQAKAWLQAIETGQTTLVVSGAEAARSIALIEACYERRQLLELPWVRPANLQLDVSQTKVGDEASQTVSKV